MEATEPLGQLEAELIRATHEKRLRSALDLLSARARSDSERDRVAEVKEAVAAFDARQAVAVDRVVGLLAAAGVDSIPVREDGLDGHQTLHVTRDDSARAVDTLLEAGFTHRHHLSPGARRARQNVMRSVSLTSTDAGLLDLRLVWGSRLDRSWFGRRIHPGLTDLTWRELPSSLWWAYWLVKPFRVAFASSGSGSVTTSVPYLPTPRSLVADVLRVAGPTPDDVIVDLGCGDGRALIEACSVFGCRGRGVELDPALAREAETLVVGAGLGDVIAIELGDISSTDLMGSTIGYAFLPASVIERLLPSLLERMPAGFRLVVHELERIDMPRSPDMARLIATPAGVTVAHLWRH